jgi:hypothetical protein
VDETIFNTNPVAVVVVEKVWEEPVKVFKEVMPPPAPASA